MNSSAYDLFISYKSENLNFASQLYERLIGEDFSVWFDKARLNPGCKWHAEIEAGCEASRIILPVLTPRWKESEWTKFETYGAEFVIPLLCEGDFEDAAPLPLREYQFSDFRQPDEETWNQLFASIRQYLDQEPPEKTQRLAFVPYAHNPYFVGREKHLLDIHEKLCRAPSTALTQGSAQAVSGLGGVGKTTLAREYAEKFWRLYRDILWVRVRADRPMVFEFQRLAEELGLIRERSQDPEEDARKAMQELSGRTRRLLIMDNAPDEESIQEWVPTTGHCRTIITSRFAGWSAAVQNIQVDVLEPSPARELLLKRSGMPDSEENRESADRVAKELGYLPLALEHAAAFVQEASISFDQYLAHYTEARSRRDLIAQRVLGSTQYPDSVATTWLVTIQRLGPLARSILTLIGFLAPDDIPRSIVTEAGVSLREGMLEIQPANEQDEIEVSAYALDQALAELKGFSMISLQQESLSVHRLVQAVQRDGLDESALSHWADRAVRVVKNAFPDPEFPNWQTCERLITHVGACAVFIKRLALKFSEAADLLHASGGYLHRRAQYAAAEPLFLQASDIYRTVLGERHPAFADSLNSLGVLYCEIGNYSDAEKLHQQSLEIWRTALGEQHPDYASGLSNLALLYRAMGNYAAAEPLLRQALEIERTALGEQHPSYATSLHNLAFLYEATGNYAAAEPLYRQALEIWRTALGEQHPNYGGSLNNLANLYYLMGNYAAAEPLFRQALEIERTAMGEQHSSYANNLNGLALLYEATGNYAAAEPLYQQALEIWRTALGDQHTEYTTGLINLSGLYLKMGNYAAAEPLLRQALEMDRISLGEQHPNYAIDLNYLANLYYSMGNYAAAEPLFRQALEIERTALGEQHPNYGASLNNLALLYRAMGNDADAEPLFRQALEIWRTALGEQHPEYATGLINLSGLYRKMGNYAAAEPLIRQALEIWRTIRGEGHPDYATVLGNLADLYYLMGNYAAAEPLFRHVLATCEQRYGADDLQTATSLNSLLRCLQGQDKHKEALPFCRSALSIREQRLEAGHPDIATSLNNLGMSLVCLGGDDNLAEAEQHLLRAVQINEKYPNPRYWLARLYQKRGRDGDRELEMAEWRHYLELEPTSEARGNEAVARLEDLSGQESFD